MIGNEQLRAQERRARRAWIAANHPDRGGDPNAFADGLRKLGAPRVDPAPAARVTAYRSRSPWRRLRRLVRSVRRRGDPRRPLT